MPAIITNEFRTYNADNFIDSFASNKVYLMIGNADAWSGADLGQYTESTPSDTAIPVPIDTTIAPYIHHNDMIAAKLINESDVSHVIKRKDWTSGTVYDEYDHEQNDLIDEATADTSLAITPLFETKFDIPVVPLIYPPTNIPL